MTKKNIEKIQEIKLGIKVYTCDIYTKFWISGWKRKEAIVAGKILYTLLHNSAKLYVIFFGLVRGIYSQKNISYEYINQYWKWRKNSSFI